MLRHLSRDRLPARTGARALTSPSGILLAGVVAGVTLTLGVPLAAALPLAGAAWVGRAAWTLAAVQLGGRIDPFTLQEPWRQLVRDALRQRASLDAAVQGLPDGPLADRLRELGGSLRGLARETWLDARRGHTLSQARRTIDLPGIERRLATLPADETDDTGETDQTHDAEQADEADRTERAVARSLRAQKATAERLDGLIARVEGELRSRNARMGEAAARIVELAHAGSASPTAGLDRLDDDLDRLLGEMEALRQALDETHGRGPDGPRPGAA